jgi:uncharacterized Ntn-hydrolase superfamily protein
VSGEPATYTGEACSAWAGGIVGTHYTCQGNILVGEETILSMAQTFEEAEWRLCDRLMAALAAGQSAGGDRRGQQSVALLVVREHGGFRGFNDRMIDLRVDDHPDPIHELQRILRVRLADTRWSGRDKSSPASRNQVAQWTKKDPQQECSDSALLVGLL